MSEEIIALQMELIMQRVYISAMEAMKAAHNIFCLLRRPVTRCIAVNRHGLPVWVVSLDKIAQNAL